MAIKQIIYELEAILNVKIRGFNFFKVSNVLKKYVDLEPKYYIMRQVRNKMPLDLNYDLIASEICEKHGVTIQDLQSGKRGSQIVSARIEFVRHMVHEYPNIIHLTLARYLKKDHTTICHYLYHTKKECIYEPLKEYKVNLTD